jgi:hypothetical protein
VAKTAAAGAAAAKKGRKSVVRAENSDITRVELRVGRGMGRRKGTRKIIFLLYRSFNMVAEALVTYALNHCGPRRSLSYCRNYSDLYHHLYVQASP